MNYPILNDVTPVLEAVSNRPEFGFRRHPNTSLVSICYMISEKDSFDDAARREARGIMFDVSTNEVVLRPFHKFFNVGERPSTQLSVIREIVGGDRLAAPVKMDGTMIVMGFYQDALITATKRTIVDDPWYQCALPVMESIRAHYGQVTVMFERLFKVLGPDHQHLLSYDEDCLVLLAIRDNRTGEYLSIDEWMHATGTVLKNDTGIIRSCGVEYFDDVDAMVAAHHETTDVEGWVLFVNGEYYKFKTDWYIKRHHIVGNLSERSIAKLVLAENIDDAMAYLNIRFKDSPVLERAQYAATKVSTDFNLWLAAIDAMVERYADVEMREVAQQLSKSDLYLLNRRRKGDKIDWPGQFFKEFKDRYSCDLFYRLEND